ncbi:CoA pyrophosphatase [Klebsiella pneumoniae subsp. pneumoniae]|nr:CoA pyrophosphatase [Klebsiella pneumoniae subsp. pneumoniae]
MADRALNLDDFLSRFQLLRPQPSRHALNQRQAAVLGADRASAAARPAADPAFAAAAKHAGQVAFPGGAVDNTDATLIAAALREAQEEVAIPPEAVEVIGVLPPVDSVTGFQVTPVVGIIPPDLHYHASQDEVSAVFEMPLAGSPAPWALPSARISTAGATTTASGSLGTSIILSGE